MLFLLAHCVKSVCWRSFSGLNAGKYRKSLFLTFATEKQSPAGAFLKKLLSP